MVRKRFSREICGWNVYNISEPKLVMVMYSIAQVERKDWLLSCGLVRLQLVRLYCLPSIL